MHVLRCLPLSTALLSPFRPNRPTLERQHSPTIASRMYLISISPSTASEWPVLAHRGGPSALNPSPSSTPGPADCRPLKYHPHSSAALPSTTTTHNPLALQIPLRDLSPPSLSAFQP
ncbi:hypothetical protein BDY17DRAFT_48957 [Neohortaea acidophila]|uniref:Uncharacterized protein n=1 Tax=Neohortaea acidophila TaxID=245834 RepID=A0A6A6PGN7_9PEZI|nr:uncharacterized protein BDY17DRAFT_48957 [Neohortaea acidophila]KAF2479085.1 hypothetical protein BDY17DRAFT_48957 [Neohortaea acidophila]